MTDDDFLLMSQPFKMNAQGFGEAVFYTMLQVFLHQEVAPTVAKSTATFAIVAQGTGFISCVSVLPKHGFSLLIAFTVSELLPILGCEPLQKIEGLRSFMESSTIRFFS